jgi:hypothetical protein
MTRLPAPPSPPALAPLRALRSRALCAALSAALSASLSACDGAGGAHQGGADGAGADGGGAEDSFNDHARPHALTEADFDALAAPDPAGAALKFFMSGFYRDEPEVTRLLDSSFYSLHDEYYWFRLLNGRPVWGFDTPPVPGLSLSSISEAYAWARRTLAAGEPLPLDLRFTTHERLYSPSFYAVALGAPRHVLLGSVLKIPAQAGRPRPEALWAFELEYSDTPSADDLLAARARLDSALPPQARPLRWLLRSPLQEAVAEELLRRGEPPEALLRYSDLSVPGARAVYSEGLTAGRVHIIRAGELATAEAGELLVFDHIPDDLPACRGLLTSAPQTPLAHINLLARNRQIPNVYVSGIADEPRVAQMSPVRAPAALWARAPDEWALEPLTQDEYRAVSATLAPPRRTLTAIDLSAQPYLYDLDALPLAAALALRPAIGGKSAGLTSLIAAGAHTPYGATALTGRAYAEHLAPLRATLEALLADPTFSREPRARYLALEGRAAYAARYSSAADAEYARALTASATGALALALEAGGARALVRRAPIPAAALSAITVALRERFAALSPQQGLRFRSSSSVEDLEGFNGAGLYASFTGYLYPQVLSGARRAQTVAWALREVWASYWGAEAFEERRAEGIDHLSGHMSALIHPHFQDEAERANGVLTLTLTPPPPTQRPLSAPPPPALTPIAVAEINAQAGALSVTNPERPDALPEVSRVEVWAGEGGALEARVTRLQPSTERAEVLTEAELSLLTLRTLDATRAWLDAERGATEPARHPSTLTLDVEFRAVEAWWPLSREPLGAGSGEARLLFKQARPLEPTARGLTDELAAADFPIDLLRRARLARRWRCAQVGAPGAAGEVAPLSLSVTQVYSDPLLTPSLGYERAPMSSAFTLLNPLDGREWRFSHLSAVAVPSAEGEGWSLSIFAREGHDLPLRALSVGGLPPSGGAALLRWWTRGGEERAVSVECAPEVLFASPSELLRELLRARGVEVGDGAHP